MDTTVSVVFMGICAIIVLFLIDLGFASDDQRKPLCYHLIMLPVLILRELPGFMKTVFPKRKNTALSAVGSDNPQIDKELKRIREITETRTLKGRLDTYKALDNLLETTEQRVRDLQSLDLKEKTEQSKVDLSKFKMVKSLETFNLCSDLIRKNAVLMNSIKNTSDEQGILILQKVMGMSPEEAKANGRMLLQIVLWCKRCHNVAC